MKKLSIIIAIVLLFLVGFGFGCDDNNSPDYSYIDVSSIEVDSVAMSNIIGKWQRIIMEDITNNVIVFDSNETLVFLENGDFGIETNGIIALKGNSYYKIAYGSIYYINKQISKVDSMRSFVTDIEKEILGDRYKDRLGLVYEIPKGFSCFPQTDELKIEIIWYKKVEDK